MDIVWIAPLAVLVGTVMGALGGGGAILTVPILVYLLGQSPKEATAGSLVVVALAAVAGLVTHLRAGNVRVRDGLVFGLVGTVGSLLGSFANHLVSGPVLMSMFAALLLVVAVLMTLKRRADRRTRARGAEGRSGGPVTLVATATGVGVLTGFFGVGGGFAVVPALVLVLGLSMPVAVGTSLLVIVLNSLAAITGRLGSGLHTDWPVILTFAVLAAAGTSVGGRLSRRVDSDRLNVAFTVLLVLVALFVGSQNLPRLLS